MINKMKITFTILSGMLLFVGGALISHAQVPEFSGQWNTITSKGKKIVVVLKSTERRSVVAGSYSVNGLTMAGYREPDRSMEAFAFINVSATSAEPPIQNMSSIRGTVTANVLRFRWIEDGGHGSGRFTMSADGRSFQGVFSKTDNPDDGSGGTWNGTRAPNFAGVWQMSGGPFPSTQMFIQDSAGQITGHLFAGNPGQGIIKNGSVDGDTIRFSVYRPMVAVPGRFEQEQLIGVAEFVMAADGKSFKGTMSGVPATGTRVGR